MYLDFRVINLFLFEISYLNFIFDKFNKWSADKLQY